MPISLPRRALVAAMLGLVLGAGAATAQRSDMPVIAAAANLQFALPEIAAAFAAETGAQVRTVFGATGTLSRQIRAGAPFELFLAADDATPRALHADGLTRDAGRVYARGRIVLVAPVGSPLDPARGLDGVAALAAAGGLSRFAIANPDHAPFGIAAREALQATGLHETLTPFLVMGENAAQAAQFALSGNAEGGIVPLSLVRAPQVAGRGTHAPIPQDLHAPLDQRMVLLPRAGPVAEAFAAFMAGSQAGAILAHHGMPPPGGG